MISHEHKVIFIHVPKTGGESIEQYFGQTVKEKKHWSMRQHDKENSELANTYFSFGVSRNPWDRYVSFVAYNKRMDHSSQPLLQAVRENIYHEYFHIHSTRHMLFDRRGKLCVDTVLRFENLNEEFQAMCRRLNLDSKPLIHKNKSEHLHYSKYYSFEDMMRIYWLHRFEIKRFKHVFDGRFDDVSLARKIMGCVSTYVEVALFERRKKLKRKLYSA